MTCLVDPQVEKAKVLVNYAKGDFSLRKEVEKIVEEAPVLIRSTPKLDTGPFQFEEEVLNGIINAGKNVVEMNFATSTFGNVSVFFNEKMYISSTGSQLDNLKDSISICDFNGNLLNSIEPSSEYPSHFETYKKTSARCILHAHPFFTVAMSMIAGVGKTLFGIPIVGGEAGGGKDGIVHTVPFELKKLNIVVVHGHGVFAVDSFDFNNPLNAIHKLEKLSRKRYISKYLS